MADTWITDISHFLDEQGRAATGKKARGILNGNYCHVLVPGTGVSD